MKKTLLIFAAVAALMMSVPAQAQVKFGVRGGVNLTNMKFSEGVFGAENRAGFYVGPTVKFQLPIVGLGIDASALYDQRQARVTADEGSSILTSKTIAIPVNARYGWGSASMVNVFLFAGPQVAFNVSKDKENYEWKKASLSINVGLGCTLFTHYEIRANYNIACTKNGESIIDYKNVKESTKYNSWQIGVGYYF